MAPPQRFSNYLRANRKRLGLSQEEVAFLLGSDSGAKVCRYEQFAREPNLKTALACEAVFQKSVSELLPGLYAKTTADVIKRAKVLLRTLEDQPPTPPTERKREVLQHIINQSKSKPETGV